MKQNRRGGKCDVFPFPLTDSRRLNSIAIALSAIAQVCGGVELGR